MAKESMYITLTEFARRLKVERETIRGAINSGKIPNKLIRRDGKGRITGIKFKEAAAEWRKQHKFHGNKPGLNDKLKAIAAGETASEPAKDVQLSDEMEYQRARRREQELKAEKLGLEVDKLKGDLVKKDDVYRSLFTFGQQIRDAMISVPDRVIDSILAAADRTSAHKILSDEIRQVLNRLADGPAIKAEEPDATTGNSDTNPPPAPTKRKGKK